MDNYPINLRIPRKSKGFEKPDWEAFHRNQEIHEIAFQQMRECWRNQYNSGESYETRKLAGENLGYSETRIFVHELFRSLSWFNDKLIC